jgi:hypothetical protein
MATTIGQRLLASVLGQQLSIGTDRGMSNAAQSIRAGKLSARGSWKTRSHLPAAFDPVSNRNWALLKKGAKHADSRFRSFRSVFRRSLAFSMTPTSLPILDAPFGSKGNSTTRR